MDYLVPVMSVLSFLVLIVLLFVKTEKSSTRTEEERIAYITRLLKNLFPIVLILVTNAEYLYGGKTGSFKRSYVIDELYKRVPDEYKKFVSEENLDVLINNVLPKAEDLWNENPQLVGRT